MEITGLFKKEVSKSVNPAKKTVISDKEVPSEKVPSSTQVFNSCYANENKDPYINKTYEKS